MSDPAPDNTDHTVADIDAPERIRRTAVLLAALAQDGLTFAPSDYDRDRYAKVAGLAHDLFSALTDRPAGEFAVELGADSGYATPKVDVRGAVLDEHERFLMMRERADGRWSLPGGWADPGDTPSAACVREIREETGYEATVSKLVACWDRDARGHLPKMAVAVYKLFFLCRTDGSHRDPDELETLDVGWFGIDELPELSQGRVTRWELERVLAHHRDPSLPTELD